MDDDTQRFTALYDTWYPRVLAYTMAHAAPQVAEDIVSETFIVAWRRLADMPEQPLPWLLTVARNIRLKHRDGQHRQQSLAARIAAMSDESDAREWDVADLVVERTEAIRALSMLSPNDLEVLILTVWQGLDAHGVARVLRCSRATAFVRLHRARRRLRQALNAIGPGTQRGLPIQSTAR